MALQKSTMYITTIHFSDACKLSKTCESIRITVAVSMSE